MGQFTTNSYAELVSQRSVKTERYQTLTKLNPLGMGILYNWEWAWSYSKNLKDEELKKPSVGRYGVSGENGRQSGTFTYIGLSVQLPTMERIRGGHLKSVSKEADRKFYRALGTALFNDIDNNENRTIPDGTAIPEIFHICSLFDLGALEKYMISKYKTFTGRSTYSDFGSLVQDLRGSANGDMIGVNTDAGGGGGPLLNTNRPVQEWIMAAYYYINETNSSIIASRGDKYGGLNVSFKTGSSLAEKIRDVFIEADKKYSSSVTARFISQSGIDKTNRKVLGLIPNFLAALGLKEDVGIATKQDGSIDEEANFKETLRGRQGRDFILSLSVDSKDVKTKIFYSDSGFVSSKRDAFINKVLDEKAIMAGKLDRIDMNIEEAFVSLTDSARAAGAQMVLAEIQKKKNAIVAALTNDAYNDIAVLQAFVKTKKEIIEKVNDNVQIPGYLEEEIKGQISKAKQSIIKSFAEAEKILEQCIKTASNKYKDKAKTDRKTDSKFMKDS